MASPLPPAPSISANGSPCLHSGQPASLNSSRRGRPGGSARLVSHCNLSSLACQATIALTSQRRGPPVPLSDNPRGGDFMSSLPPRPIPGRIWDLSRAHPGSRFLLLFSSDISFFLHFLCTGPRGDFETGASFSRLSRRDPPTCRPIMKRGLHLCHFSPRSTGRRLPQRASLARGPTRSRLLGRF
jgi:hypothetical protein